MYRVTRSSEGSPIEHIADFTRPAPARAYCRTESRLRLLDAYTLTAPDGTTWVFVAGHETPSANVQRIAEVA